jgi:glycosyltransferase involved in cell wall biosynthesis
MIIPDIIIPTCKKIDEISPLLGIVGFNSPDCTIIATCKPVSAAINRNDGLNQATSDIVIMIDDDTGGYYKNWWRDLIRPLIEDSSIVYVSARLIKEDGTPAPMMHNNPCMTRDVVDVPYAPTACVAFRNDNLRFDEGYIGSGYEDTDFCEQLKIRYPNKWFVINNTCRIIHKNEQKFQHGKFAELNRQRYQQKWNKFFTG